MRVSGRSGRLLAGRLVAADLGRWELDVDPRHHGQVRARVSIENAHRMAQQSFDLSLHIAGSDWIWRGVKVRREGRDAFIDVAGRPEVETLVGIR